MPPKARITREMVIDAAFAITREQGIASVNARAVSEALGCSTQPVMYHFRRIEDMKRAVYAKADAYHTAFITQPGEGNPMLSIGMNYIRFARQEKHLFRLLFQTNEFEGKSVVGLMEDEALAPVIAVLSGATGVPHKQARSMFRLLFLLVHGYASMLANNDLAYDEAEIIRDLTRAFAGVLQTMKEEEP